MSNVFIFQIVRRGTAIVAFIFLRITRRALKRGRYVLFLFWCIVTVSFVRARFVEPYQLSVQEHSVDLGLGVTVAVFADTHLGVYKDWRFLQRVVNMINRRDDIDYVMIAGDFTFEPTPKQRLMELFEPLGDLNVTTIAVLGNHDIQVPGPDLREDLVDTLVMQDVVFLQNDVIELSGFYLVGLGEHTGGEDDVRMLDEFSQRDTVIVLTHNPDTTLNYRNNNADLTIAGHTHCGQIRPPLLYPLLRKYYVPVEGDFDCGLTEEQRTMLFITRGVGEVLLPMRFFAPPTIDILHL